MTDHRTHWTEAAERTWEADDHPLWGLVGECPDGRLWLPSWRRKDWWDRPLNLRRPTHWLPWLHSRLARKVAFLDG